MLVKVICSLFKRQEIVFHPGLNVILGSDDAKNSIGKSSALIVVDFAMGGDSLLEDKTGTIKALGHHSYKFEFIFSQVSHYFSRSTAVPDAVSVCDKNYSVVENISTDDYRRKLKSLYVIDGLTSSFRSIVSPFSRIWHKGALDPDQPFSGDIREPARIGIERLIDLFRRTGDILEERSVLEAHKERKALLSKSMTAAIIPKINKTKYKENQRVIHNNNVVIDELKKGFAGALSAYEALFDEGLRALQHQKIDLVNERSVLRAKIDRLERDISGVTPGVAANIALVAEFFPDVNIQRLEKVEAFHQNIGRLVRAELKKELAELSAKEDGLSSMIGSIEGRIHQALESKGTPDDLFARAFELKDVVDKASEENRFYDQKEAVDAAAKLSKERLESIYIRIFSDIEREINSKLISFNRVVYGGDRNAPQLRIKGANSFSFTSATDTGTGNVYAGMIGFDLAILSLTGLPFLIHDSVIYKNIEVPATRNILRILAAVKRKQVFLSFDEASKFGGRAAQILHAKAVLKLNKDELLYSRDWKAKAEDT